MQIKFCSILLLFAICFSPVPTLAWDVTKVIDNGGPSNRINIIAVGDGFTASEIDTYVNHVNFFLLNDAPDGPFGFSDDGYFFETPQEEYKPYFNVYRVDVISNESGIDRPPNTSVDTALDCCLGCQPAPSAVLCDPAKIYTAAAEANVDWDFVFVLANDPSFAGNGFSNYMTFTAGTGDEMGRVVLHESGHVYPDPWLADEYFAPGQQYPGSNEPWHPNCTLQIQHANIKWNEWINPGTPLPTPPGLPECYAGTDVGAYEGCAYYGLGIYRPTCNSMMRNGNLPFEAINTEAIVKQIYTSVSPIDNYCPRKNIVKVAQNGQQVFSVTRMAPITHNLRVTWYLDGNQVGQDATYALLGNSLTIGNHSLKAVVFDPTGFVRDDQDELLKDEQEWTVSLNSTVSDLPVPCP